jgi:DNA-binding response OmpR family regulator
MTIPASPVVVGPVVLDVTERTFTVNGGDVTPLTTQQAKVLHGLMRFPGSTVSRERLGLLLWGDDTYDRDPRTVDQFVMQLRRKLAQAGAPHVIENLRGDGWSFVRAPDCVTRSFTRETWDRIEALACREGIDL